MEMNISGVGLKRFCIALLGQTWLEKKIKWHRRKTAVEIRKK